ncbi:MAG: glycoside hydrolase family 3 protein [Defluviitaleaceae bacterium]|nr:glycoside hydrolase family 3 protein [Defluviitaleaceae bacterium]
MTLEQKIGQLFLVKINGPIISDGYSRHLKKTKIGNYILFAKDLTDYSSIRKLTDSLQDMAMESCGIPAFISADQEGGMVTRVFSGATHFPSNMAITASGMGYAATERVGEMVGQELRSLGINVNHAPILDVNNNPQNPIIGIRAYSDDPAVVAKMGVGYIKGLQKSGVIAGGKHFPGHGDTSFDSHLDSPSIEHDMERLEKVELVPFREAIEGGVDSLMTAHIIFKAIEKDVPATLSKKTITDFLRKKLGFEGLVITDCMTMKAVKDNFTTEKGCVMALNAGVDLICLNADPDIQEACYNTVLAAALSGELPMEKIDAAVERVLHYKKKYGIGNPAPKPQNIYPTHEALADEISAKSITITQGDMLPIAGKKFLIISPPPVRTSIADDTVTTMDAFCKQAAAEFDNDYIELSINPSSAEIASVIKAAELYDMVLYGCYSAMVNPGQIELFDALKDKKIILVSLRIPYDILKMKNAGCHIAAYEYTDRAVKNTINVLAGKAKAVGTMPVKL